MYSCLLVLLLIVLHMPTIPLANGTLQASEYIFMYIYGFGIKIVLLLSLSLPRSPPPRQPTLQIGVATARSIYPSVHRLAYLLRTRQLENVNPQKAAINR